MANQELIEKINTVLSEEFEVDIENITPDANIKSTLELDSLAIVDLVGLVENEFGVKIPSAEVGTILTFQSLYDYIAEHQA
ncbi:MAG: acyl carrier protein [Bacteroidales bacterium]|jgi:acyl carrier protein|nr:acyl carrier protein [Bacteroidales bacterium]MBO7442519.1 acyl carrier protein [Paludibacteraceae bacterium]MBQ0155986.1 acyl carrier protein [Candidatus Scybalocola fimicaballi]MBO7627148.1 acyl carrier protein [Paludibacteraceae bacterium]MBP5525384.1 acyl carrier protein [Paludibacteraceae bacterium]